MKADYQTFKNLMQKVTNQHQRLDCDIVTSLRKWATKLKDMGWHVMSNIQTTPKPKIVFAFFLPWQKEQIRLHGGDLLCIDSTHNATKIVPTLGVKKLSTFTLLLRQPDTGRGLPVAWFLTSDKTAHVVHSPYVDTNLTHSHLAALPPRQYYTGYNPTITSIRGRS